MSRRAAGRTEAPATPITRVNATTGHSYSENNFDDYLIPDACGPIHSLFTVTPPNGSPTTVTNLAGNTQQGDTVSVTVPSGSTQDYTLVGYTAPGSTFSDSTAYQQVIYQQATGTYSTATDHTLTVTDPQQLLPDRLRLRPGDRPVGAEPERQCLWSGQRQHPLSRRESLHLVGQRRHDGPQSHAGADARDAATPDDRPPRRPDPDRLGDAVGRLQSRPARSPSTCSRRASRPNGPTATTSTATRSRSAATAPTPRPGQQPRRLRADGDRHLPVGGRLQRRHQQQCVAGAFGSEPETVSACQPRR